MAASVTITPQATKELAKLPMKVRERIGRFFERLAEWPDVSGAKPLKGKLAGFYRMRTGDYRIRFQVGGERIIVEKIGHRKDVYED